MDLGVRDRAYLVVGGTAGMGKAAARTLAADGSRVAVAGRGRERAEAEASEQLLLPVPMFFCSCMRIHALRCGS